MAWALERLAPSLGESEPMIVQGRRVKATLDALPADAIVVTEPALAAAIHRAWPVRRNTDATNSASAALLIAALRTER
ncbi:MAG: hypothetical protein ACRDQC_14315 [Gaiellales bacterium]